MKQGPQTGNTGQARLIPLKLPTAPSRAPKGFQIIISAIPQTSQTPYCLTKRLLQSVKCVITRDKLDIV